MAAAFADLTITTDDNLFASEHNVGRSLQAVNDRFATRVQIVESERKKLFAVKRIWLGTSFNLLGYMVKLAKKK